MAAHATLGVSEAHYVDYPVTARRLMILTRVMIPTRVVTRTLRWSIRREHGPSSPAATATPGTHQGPDPSSVEFGARREGRTENRLSLAK